MPTISRPIIIIGKDLDLMWDEVPGASSYRFKIIKKETSKEFWEIEISKQQSNILCKNGNCRCNYPQDKPFLEPLVSYLFIATAEANNEEIINSFESEFLLLDENAQKAVNDYEDLVYSEGTKALRNQWTLVKHAISDGTALKGAISDVTALDIFTAPPPRWPRGWCLSAHFNLDNNADEE